MTTHFYGNRQSANVLIQFVDDHDLSLIEQEVGHIQKLAHNASFLLAAIKIDDWNNDLSPWPAPPVFGNENFGDGASKTLSWLTEELIPELRYPKQNQESEKDATGNGSGKISERKFYIGGYSLSGLFALWAVYQTNLFRGAAAASPSVWFPGFREYIRKHRLLTDAVYLSLGDKEERTRNAVMSQVGDAIRDIHQYYEEIHIPTILEWNPGNHFREPDLRTAKGFAWLLNRI